MAKILVIDDEETLLENFGNFLKTRGHGVFTAKDGDRGMVLFKENIPDLLVLDMHLKSGPSGEEILKLARMLRPDMKIIILTGFGDEEDTREFCISFGVNAFLGKPITLKNFVDTVEKILQEDK